LQSDELDSVYVATVSVRSHDLEAAFLTQQYVVCSESERNDRKFFVVGIDEIMLRLLGARLFSPGT
jgi:hypothetical protein